MPKTTIDKAWRRNVKMIENLMTLKNLMMRLKSPEPFDEKLLKMVESEKAELENMGVKVDSLFYELEPETLEVAKLYANFYIRRYEEEGKKLKKENPQKFESCVKRRRFNPDGTLPPERKMHQLRMGITQKAFEITLQQLQIPYIPNDPTIDWRPKSYKLEDPLDKTTKFSYDFYIPFFGRIDIKSSTLKDPVVRINCREFERENPDYVVAYMILDIKQPKWLKLLGYLTNSEVRRYKPKGKGYRKYYPIPAKDFEKHSGEELLLRLMLVRYVIKQLESKPQYDLLR